MFSLKEIGMSLISNLHDTINNTDIFHHLQKHPKLRHQNLLNFQAPTSHIQP